ncbi:MAG: SMP-30/gluconolactonase/LRE family protein [Bacteroidales bacterium]|nr:SMP-30/gluconolactonase/LRE family protein [Bacteroidales bacterium]
MRKKTNLFLFLILTGVLLLQQVSALESVYTQKPDDPEAVYFTPSGFAIKADGKTDVSDELQKAINQLKTDKNFGIVFIPEGTYLISKTIYIPAAIRLIGYGNKRPLFVLKKNSPGFQQPDMADKGKASYMFWFTSSIPEAGKPIPDAHAGTFYSALSNIDLKIEDGNPSAVALRTHFAQHSYIAHCNIYAGKGKAGLYDIGNMIENVKFYGGEYGIYTTKASPGWQFMMLDTYFEGQRKAAVQTQEAGFTIVRMDVKNVPSVFMVSDNYWEKLYIEDSRFENISGPAITFDNENNAHMQINIRNLACKNVPVLVNYAKSKTQTQAPTAIYKVNRYVYGLQMDDIDATPAYNTVFEASPLTVFPAMPTSDIVSAPAMGTWANIKLLGAKGDGKTDDTRIFNEAIEKYDAIYLPQGSYLISETLKLKPNTCLIGLNPISTNIVIAEASPAYSGFGSPVPMLETPQNGQNIIAGIGLNTGQSNYRAVACKWMAGEKSLLDDVKFIGGHGTMDPGPKVPWEWIRLPQQREQTGRRSYSFFEQTWDTQYWSLWVTNNGGGVFKNIWTANTFSVSGLYASNTSTRGRIYAMSVEHHVRNEVRFKNVSNWKVFALQLEEESRESSECLPLEIEKCNDMVFANLYMFRVIRVKVPFPYSVRTWDCKNLEILNIHNYSQIKYTTDNPLYDINTNIEVRPQEMARLYISGNTPTIGSEYTAGTVQKVAQGFEFALGSCSDSKGNVYFAEQRMKRIYKWSAETQSLALVADFQWEPLALACDSKDNLLVLFRYNPQPAYLVNGQQEKFVNPPDANGTSFSGWGNSGFASLVYAINPEKPDETIQKLEIVPMGSVREIHKALYPSNRWRDSHDFNSIAVARAEECFIAPDGKTIIPVSYDLARTCGLVEAFPGKALYVADEYDKRTVQIDVDQQGYLSNLRYFAEFGEFFSLTDNSGNVFIADGEVYKFSANGNLNELIKVPERPTTLAFGGKDKNTLFIVGKKAFYRLLPEGK